MKTTSPLSTLTISLAFTQFTVSEEIVVIDNPNSVYAFNRPEEEGHVERYGCHFKLIDLTREDLYDMGVPPVEE